MFENTNRTELEQLGEFGLIKHISSTVTLRNPTSVKGIGDDCAVIDRGNHYELLTTDLLLEGIHFDLSYTPLKHVGYKSVMVNASDIYAMNGTPTQILSSIGLSNRVSLEAVEELYAGMLLACDHLGIDLIGGDTSSSASGLVISITAIGTCEKEKVVYRSGAVENDLICVSGDLGSAYIGLQVLNREKKMFLDNPAVQPDLSGSDYVVERQLKPEAGKDIIEALSKEGILPTSMIDISDGLSSELFHICTASDTGCRIYEEKIPIDIQTGLIAEEFNLNPSMCALNGGEDYELLFTIRQSDYEKIKMLNKISVIGHITPSSAGLALIDRGGHETPLRAQGWDGIRK
ncbi:MAG TPA: thiamine-phosphate kinase [Bacteroidia bacterium]|nr:thiamine-phosphate kinase [Bacteroidia bacterium]